jgi:hypothetical protein
MEIKEYCNKNKLDYSNLDSEFDISSIEKGNFSLKIAEKIVEKVEKYRKLMEEFLQADGSSFAALMEIKGFDEKDKDKINHIYKDLIMIDREFLVNELENDEKSTLEFIGNYVDKWYKVKLDIIEIIKKAKDSWKKDTNISEELEYLR